jgi:hypothetical protein
MKKIILILTVTLAALLLSGCMGGEAISADPNAVPIDQMPAAPPGLVEPEPVSGVQLSYAKAPGAVAVMNGAISGDTNRFAEQYARDIGDYDVSTVRFLGNSGLLIIGETAVYAVVPFDDYFVMISGTSERDVANFLAAFTVAS